MAVPKLDTWKRILLNPCDRSAQRRNEAAIRDSFEEITNYITNVTNVTGGGSLVFFKVTATAVGDPTTTAKLLTIPGFAVDGADVVIHDYTPNLRFSPNFVDGYYGCGVPAPDIAPNAVIIVELEGKARFIDGTLNEDMQPDKLVEVTVENYWGAFPNIHDPGTNFDVHDRNDLAPNGKTGDRFVAVWDEQEEEYVLLNLNDREVIFFMVNDTDLGAASVEVLELDLNTLTPTGRTMTAYDVTPNSRFGMNFVEGYYGCGRHAPEIDTDAIAIFELEGKARYIDGVLTSNVTTSATGTVTNYWGAYPNIHDPGSPVTIHDREGYAEGALTGQRYLAVWDEQDQQYVFILPSICDCGVNADVEYLQFCGDDETVANECCLFEGVIYRIDPETIDFCNPDYCLIPVWLYCYQGVAENDPWPLSSAWCDFGKRIKQQHDCDGDIRDVYGIDCGDCDPCRCPGSRFTVTLEAFDCQAEQTFTVYCVENNPITGIDGAGWWGEFTFTGEYPMVARGFSLDTPIMFEGEEQTEIYAVIGCNGTGMSTVENYCQITKMYFWKNDGTWHEYTGAYTIELDGGLPVESPSTVPGSGGYYFITDDEECQLWCPRTHRYGIYIKCTEGGAYTTAGVAVYRLYPDASIVRVVDNCIGHFVPDGDYAFSDPNGPTSELHPVNCCNPLNSDLMDIGFSFSYTCLVPLPNETTGLSITINPFAFETFGGCRDTTVAAYGVIPECSPGTGVTTVRFVYNVSGTEKCKGTGVDGL